MALDFLKTAAMVIIFGALWNYARTRAASSGDRPGRLAQGMSFIYN